MAAVTADPPVRKVPAQRRQRYRRPNVVVQPARTIIRGGREVDISHLTGDDLYEALTSDEAIWDTQRIADEAGRSLGTARRWVGNAYALDEGRQVNPDDKTFILPDGFNGRSPWWYAGRARACLIQIEVMRRDGTFRPHSPSGRPRDRMDSAPRKRRNDATLDREAPKVMAAYRKLRAGDPAKGIEPLADRAARDALATKLKLTRKQVARRLNWAEKLEAAAAAKAAGVTPQEIDNAALLRRFHELRRDHGEDAARTMLVEETGLNRRQLAGRLHNAQTVASRG